MTTSQTIGALAAALAKAQLKMAGAKKDSDNPFFKSKYADLASVWKAAHEALNENGLAVVQGLEDGTDFVSVETHLIHTSGEWMAAKFSMTPKARDPQGVGSCATYLRRYALAAMVGVCPVDDDAEAAQGRHVAPGTVQPVPMPSNGIPPAKKPYSRYGSPQVVTPNVVGKDGEVLPF